MKTAISDVAHWSAPPSDGRKATGMASFSFERDEVQGLVTIVIPTYQCERYIGQTLDSIGQQTYENWEVIVVEDGPAGPTQRIVEEFARRHPAHRVEYSANGRNHGPSHSRNVAFAKAAGEFVALVDSDDRWFPQHLARSVTELRETGKDLAYSTVLLVQDETDWIVGVWGPEVDELEDFPHKLFYRNFITPSATVFRRQVLADVGPWDVELRHCEDLSFWLRCFAAGKQFHYVGGCHCLYRKSREGAATQKFCETLEKFAVVVERHMRLPGVPPKALRRLVSKAYYRAAKAHAKTDPARDPSADRSRAAALMLHAWRLRPSRVKYLVRGLARAGRDRLLGRKPAMLVRVERAKSPAVAAESSRRAA